MATEPDKTPEEAKRSGGVKSYEAPERRGLPAGRVLTFVVIAVAVVALLIWLL